jgi:hypothetical protein
VKSLKKIMAPLVKECLVEILQEGISGNELLNLPKAELKRHDQEARNSDVKLQVIT